MLIAKVVPNTICTSHILLYQKKRRITMLSFMKVKGNGNNVKNEQIVIYNDENNEMIEIRGFIHRDSEPNIELVPYKIKE